MTPIKESLYHTIDALNDKEAEQVLAFAQRLQDKGHISPTIQRLANDPAFNLPSEAPNTFRAILPIQGEGIPASELLLKDRQ